MLKYKEDIKYLINKIEETHANPYLFYSKEEFYRDLEDLANKEISVEKFKYELSKILAKIKDQHTCILFSRTLFWKVKLLDGKVYIVHDYRNKNSKYIYKYIKSINNVDINNVITMFLQTVPGKISQWKKAMTQENILSKDFLKASGIIKEDEYIIELNDGTMIDVNKELEKEAVNLLNAFDYEIISEDIFYIKYATCNSPTPNRIESFFEEVKENIRTNNFKNIIIDLRRNAGGNSRYFSSFSKFLNDNAKDINYYTLTDEYVFSSGRWALQQMLELNSIVIGDVPGSFKDGFGYMSVIELPNSKIKTFCSMVYWKYENKKFNDYRKNNIHLIKEYLEEELIPDIIIQNTINDYMENKDVVLNEVLNVIKQDLKTDNIKHLINKE